MTTFNARMIIGLYFLLAMFVLGGLIGIVILCQSFTDSYWTGKTRKRSEDKET